MKKIGYVVLLAVALMALLALTGCMDQATTSSALTVIATPNSGHPPFNTTIAARCMNEGGTYTLVVEGEPSIESTGWMFDATVNTWPWPAKVIWTDGSGLILEAPVKLSLENKTPVAHGLLSTPDTYSDRELIKFDLRYLPHGCNADGGSTSATGFQDPDYTDGRNDGFTYHVEIKDIETGEKETIFYGPERTVMFPDEYVANTTFYWIVNYRGGTAPYPFVTQGEQPTKILTVCVKEFGEARRWVYPLVAGMPGCE